MWQSVRNSLHGFKLCFRTARISYMKRLYYCDFLCLNQSILRWRLDLIEMHWWIWTDVVSYEVAVVLDHVWRQFFVCLTLWLFVCRRVLSALCRQQGQCVSPVHGSYSTIFHHNCTVLIMMDEAHFRLSFVFVHQFTSIINKSGWQSSLLLNQEIVTAQIQNTSLYEGMTCYRSFSGLVISAHSLP